MTEMELPQPSKLIVAHTLNEAVGAEPIALLPEEAGVPLYGACLDDDVTQDGLEFFSELFDKSVLLREYRREETLTVPAELYQDLFLSTLRTLGAMRAINDYPDNLSGDELSRLRRLFPETRYMLYPNVPAYVGSLATGIYAHMAS